MCEEIKVSDKRDLNFRQYKILFFIIVLIGFQQFPVINVGGSLKVYEILALLVLFSYFPKIQWNWMTIGAFLLFVLSPIVSLVNFIIFVDKPILFFMRYPEATGTFKYDNIFYTFLQVVYMLFNFAVIIAIIRNKYLYFNIEKLIYFIVAVGTGISLFSIICYVIGDNPLTYLPKSVQKLSKYSDRIQGLSQEPSFYVLYQGWIVLFTYSIREKFSKSKWGLLMVINTVALILTFSSSLASFAVFVFLSPFLLKTSSKKRILSVILLCSVGFLMYCIVIYLGLEDVFSWFLYDKIDDFISNDNLQAVSSGGQRSYTAKIGMEIFKEYPIFGVGVGNSTFFMTSFEDRIHNYIEVLPLGLGMFPLTLFSCVLSEQGLLGFSGLIIFLISVLVRLFKFRNCLKFGGVFFIGTLFTIATMFAIPTTYSLFLWVFMALGYGYTKQYKYAESITN